MTTDLIDELVIYQGSQGLTDTDFAQLLGVDRSTWSYVRRRIKQPGVDFLSAVAQKIPHLQLHVFNYVVSRNGKDDGKAHV